MTRKARVCHGERPTVVVAEGHKTPTDVLRALADEIDKKEVLFAHGAVEVHYDGTWAGHDDGFYGTAYVSG